MNDPFKKYRSRFRSWKNSRRLRREKQYYQSQFVKSGLKVPDESDLRRELQKRFPGQSAKAKGELKIIAVYHHYNWENESLKLSLQQFGQVLHYDWFAEYNHQQESWQKSKKAEMNRAMIEQINQWLAAQQADLIFMYVSGELVEPITLQIIRSQGVPLVNLALNDKEHFVGKIKHGRAYGARDICRYFDLCWTSTEDALVKYCVEEALPIYLPEGANPQIHKPYDLEKTIDVSFVGQCYGNRAEVIDALRKNGIVVQAYGAGWPAGALATEDMVKLYSRSKINLGFGGVASHSDTFCLKGRDFEIPMSGGLYLTEEHPELLKTFVPGREILTYSGLDDLQRKIKYYLAHPEEADAIRRRGYERALNDHSWEKRFEKIFRLLGILD